MELLIGAGANNVRKIPYNDRNEWTKLVTLDNNQAHKPDVLWDLNDRPLPFADETFDEIHAYDVLEHLGRQGDWRAFLDEWSEWWRLLKPNGVLCGISPIYTSPWAWGDPGHTRIVSVESFTYLDQSEYTKQVGVSPITDYRFIYKADFDLIGASMHGEHSVAYVLRAIKPSRITV